MIGNARQIFVWLSSYVADEKTQYELKPYKRKRSLSQNAYYWTLLNQLADAMDFSKSEMHNRMLREYGQTATTSDGEPVRVMIKEADGRDDEILKWSTLHMRPTSQVIQGYRTYAVLKGSHELNVDEMRHLLNGLVEECRQQDIETLTPAELQTMYEREMKHATNRC